MSFRLRLISCAILFLAGAGRLLGNVGISSFNPTYGASNDVSFVNIFGNGFQSMFSPPHLTVTFNGATDTTAGAVSPTQIQARVPPNAPLGPGRIMVTVDGAFGQSTNDFTVIGPGPYVAGFAPDTVSEGPTVTLTGAHFTGVTNVAFNGVAGGNLNVSETTITVNPPPNVITGPIKVISPQGSFTTSSNYFGQPGVSGFAPGSGRAGTNVVLTGTNFLGATAVWFAGTNGSFTLQATFSVPSNSVILAVVPAGVATGKLRVDAPAGSIDTSSNFVVQPTITSFSPGFGPVGTSVTIMGANFNVATPTVKFNGVTAATPTGVSFSQLTAVVPSTTSGPISVTTSDGTVTSSTNFYLPASITAFSPTNSAPGTTVTITGVNFTNASAVAFNGAPASSFHVTNNTTIGAVVPGGVSTGPISVTTPAGTTNSSGLFYAAPAITSFSPTHGLPTTNVTIFGTNFLGATSVKFNVSIAAIVSVSNGQITATVPNGATTGPISVTAPAGTATTSSNFVLDYTSDLAVTVTALPNPEIVGSSLVYAITIANHGPFDAPNVMFTNTLPASAVLQNAATTQGTLVTNANPILGSLNTLVNGGMATVMLTVAPQSTGTITNISSAGSDYIDPAPANNTATVVTTVLPLPLLSIRVIAPNLVRISWPAALSNYFSLESKSALVTNSPWASVTNVPVVVGNERVVTQTNSAAAKFYRLRE